MLAADVSNQSVQAQANLHHATQQARVAAINAAATQAALDTATNQTATGSKTPTNVAGRQGGQALRKTAGRYALGDFQIERTSVEQISSKTNDVDWARVRLDVSISFAQNTTADSTLSRFSTRRKW